MTPTTADRPHDTGDAQRAIDRFGAHLRDDVDLTALHGRLLAAADATVQPNGAGLWIRRMGS